MKTVFDLWALVFVFFSEARLLGIVRVTKHGTKHGTKHEVQSTKHDLRFQIQNLKSKI